MTCIIGLVADGRVYLGGDSAAVHGWTRRRTRLRKVFRKGPFLVGYTTSFRMGQLLEHQLLQVRAGQVDRTGVRIDAFRDEFDDVVEGLAVSPLDICPKAFRTALRTTSKLSMKKLRLRSIFTKKSWVKSSQKLKKKKPSL